MSNPNTIHIISEKAWTLNEQQKNVIQVAMDHMVEHMEDLVKEHPEVDVYKSRYNDAKLLRVMVNPSEYLRDYLSEQEIW
tara:strand:+ start:357 stop:596 length:240 start_codon:yes stop_codon:yes gene_type:complete